MKTERIKSIIGFLMLGALLVYFGIKLFTQADTLLAILIFAMIIFVTILVWYVLQK